MRRNLLGGVRRFFARLGLVFLPFIESLSRQFDT